MGRRYPTAEPPKWLKAVVKSNEVGIRKALKASIRLVRELDAEGQLANLRRFEEASRKVNIVIGSNQ